MNTPHVKAENGLHAVYNVAETVQMGTHATAEKAEAHAVLLGSGTPMRSGLAKVKESGALLVVEGGRYVLSEGDGDLARMKDGELKKLRNTMVEKRNAVRAAHRDLTPDKQYGSPEGSALLDDLYYYNNLVSRLESEMACRMLTLD